MPYPFKNNPLNSYLISMRKLQKEDKDLLFEIYYDNSITQERRLKAEIKRNEIQKQILSTKENCLISPRKEKIFKNKAQLAVIKFEIENKKPYAFEDCKHENIETRIKTHANNTEHIANQCLKCGFVINKQKKKDVKGWKNLQKFDIYLGKKERKDLSEWKENRNKAYVNNIIEGDEIPDFNYENFCNSYTKEYPEPPSSHSCKHEMIEKTHRTYENGNDAVVIQCVSCGKYISNVKKTEVKNINNLKIFDEDRQELLDKNHGVWHEKRTEKYRKCKKKYNINIEKDILNGKYVFKINKTFNTYYDSQEWKWAREKILKRDKYICQSCHSKATCVHHITYDRLGQESSLDLISLCENCHKKIHKIQDEFYYSFRLNPLEIRDLVFL